MADRHWLSVLACVTLASGCGPPVADVHSNHNTAQQLTDAPIPAEVEPESAGESEGLDQISWSEHGRNYKEALVQAIQIADRIVVKEHADEHDFYDDETEQLVGVKEIVYGEQSLDAQQKDVLLMTIQSMDDTTQTAFPFCGPLWHHTIEFHSGGKLSSRMRICFECIHIEWDGCDKTPPAAIYRSLKTFVESIGFSAKRDWKTLAKENRS